MIVPRSKVVVDVNRAARLSSGSHYSEAQTCPGVGLAWNVFRGLNALRPRARRHHRGRLRRKGGSWMRDRKLGGANRIYSRASAKAICQSGCNTFATTAKERPSFAAGAKSGRKSTSSLSQFYAGLRDRLHTTHIMHAIHLPKRAPSKASSSRLGLFSACGGFRGGPCVRALFHTRRSVRSCSASLTALNLRSI